MEVKKITSDVTTQFYLSIEKVLNSLRRRSVVYIVNCHSSKIATVLLYVTGKRGTVQKSFIVEYEETTNKYKLYYENYEYTLDSISEINTLCKSMIARLSTTLTKI